MAICIEITENQMLTYYGLVDLVFPLIGFVWFLTATTLAGDRTVSSHFKATTKLLLAIQAIGFIVAPSALIWALQDDSVTKHFISFGLGVIVSFSSLLVAWHATNYEGEDNKLEAVPGDEKRVVERKEVAITQGSEHLKISRLLLEIDGEKGNLTVVSE